MSSFNYRLKKLNKVFDLKLVFYILKTNSKLKLFKGVIKNFDLSLKNTHFELVRLFEEYLRSKPIDEKWKRNTNRFLTDSCAKTASADLPLTYFSSFAILNSS